MHQKFILMQDLKEAISYRAALKEPIMETAMKLFAEHGIKAVKMDDIAQRMGISKRTLYEVYQDKEELLYQSIVKYDRQKRSYIEEYASQGHHVIDVIVEAYRMKVSEMHTVNPLFYEDIMKYPKVELYIKKEHERTREGFLRFMQCGVDEGCLRPDVNYKLVPYMLDAIGKHVMNTQLLKEYSVSELFNNMFLVTLRGLCTVKGLQLLEEALAAKIHKMR